MRQLTTSFTLPPDPFMTLTTVLGLVLLDPGDGHGHPVHEMLLLRRRQAPEPGKRPKPVARLLELRFQSLMLGTAYRKDEERRHRAPVENDEGESSRKANKKQTVFSPYVRQAGISRRGRSPASKPAERPACGYYRPRIYLHIDPASKQRYERLAAI
jgi:hypothetical protein